jgi:protein TonB
MEAAAAGYEGSRAPKAPPALGVLLVHLLLLLMLSELVGGRRLVEGSAGAGGGSIGAVPVFDMAPPRAPEAPVPPPEAADPGSASQPAPAAERALPPVPGADPARRDSLDASAATLPGDARPVSGPGGAGGSSSASASASAGGAPAAGRGGTAAAGTGPAGSGERGSGQGAGTAAAPARPALAADPTNVERARWARTMAPDELSRFHPAEAWRRNRAGQVVLVCQVGLDQRVRNCSVQRETPGGWGFGEAALAASRRFRVRPRVVDGAPVDGGWVFIPLRFDVSARAD